MLTMSITSKSYDIQDLEKNIKKGKVMSVSYHSTVDGINKNNMTTNKDESRDNKLYSRMADMMLSQQNYNIATPLPKKRKVKLQKAKSMLTDTPRQNRQNNTESLSDRRKQLLVASSSAPVFAVPLPSQKPEKSSAVREENEVGGYITSSLPRCTVSSFDK